MEYQIDLERLEQSNVCSFRIGPGHSASPVDLVAIATFIEDEALREKIVAYVKQINTRNFHRYETVMDGIEIRSELVPSHDIGVYTFSIDACTRHDDRPDIALESWSIY